jgi:hypothetical protein
MGAETKLILYAVYRPSREYPRNWVVRRWKLGGGLAVLVDRERPLIVAPNLEEARQGIPKGLFRIAR